MMQHIAPRFRYKGVEYILLRRGDHPLLVKSQDLEEALHGGVEYYLTATDPHDEAWERIPDDYFRQLEEKGCLEEVILGTNV